jgi:hypothetical protein
VSLRRLLIISAIALIVLPGYVCAQERSYPAIWPWRGISVPAEIAQEEIGVVKELAMQNINTVRIFFTSKRTMEQLHVSSEDAFLYNLKLVDLILDECKKFKMTAVIATDSFPTDDSKCSDKKNPEYWDNPVCIKQINHLVSLAAKKFAARGTELSAYQFLSEPVMVKNKKSLLPVKWNEILNNMLKTMREYDRSRYVIVSAGVWGFPDGYGNFPLLNDNRIIYNAHVYMPHNYTHQGITDSGDQPLTYPGRVGFTFWDKNALEKFVLPLKQFQEKHKVPVYIGEFSAVRWAPGRDQYLKDAIDIFERNGWSWIYFAFGGQTVWTGWDPRYEAVSADSKRQLSYKGYDTSTWSLLRSYYKRNVTDKKQAILREGSGAR